MANCARRYGRSLYGPRLFVRLVAIAIRSGTFCCCITVVTRLYPQAKCELESQDVMHTDFDGRTRSALVEGIANLAY